MKKGRII